IFLPLPISAVAIVMNPAVIDLAERKTWIGANHPEPVAIVNEKIRFAFYAFKIACLELIHAAQIPFADPIGNVTDAERTAIGDHLAEILGGPILIIKAKEVGLAVAVHVRWEKDVVARQAVPAGHVTVVARDDFQSRTDGAEHTEVRH